MSAKPHVSICVPTYNGREHLKECLDSILAQTFRDFEVIICDDQSSDHTLDYAREIANEDDRFHFIENPRRFGLVGNWNNCIKHARGEWIKFVFQDDIIAPACVEKLLAACQRENKAFGFCERAFIFENGTPEEMRNWFIGHNQRLCADYQKNPVIDPATIAEIVIRDWINNPNSVPTWHNPVGEPTVTLIKKSLFEKLGKFDEALIQLCDAEFWLRAMVNEGAVFVPESLAFFRIHAKATTASNFGSRNYRMWVLDSLVLRYRFAFSRHFKPMRDPRLTGKSVLSLRAACAADAAHAWKLAKLKARTKENEASTVSAEWESVIKHCAGLGTLAQWGRIINWYNRLKNGGSQTAN